MGMLLKSCEEKGIHTAIETCGYAKWEDFKKVLEYADLTLYDIKYMNNEKHRELTGVGNELILQNARKVANEFARSLRGVREIHLLPYYRLGEPKYEWLGRSVELPNLKEWDDHLCLSEDRAVGEVAAFKDKNWKIVNRHVA